LRFTLWLSKFKKEKLSSRVIYVVIILAFFIFVFRQFVFTDTFLLKLKVSKIESVVDQEYPYQLSATMAVSENNEYKTEKGKFGPSDVKRLFNCFDDIFLPGMKFLDLGSGDGRVVFLASLFGVEAYGIEFDPLLYQLSKDAMKKLKGDVDPELITLIEGDFLKYDFSEYDIFYLNEGTSDIVSLESKLYDEMNPESILLVIDSYAGYVNELRLNQTMRTHKWVEGKRYQNKKFRECGIEVVYPDK